MSSERDIVDELQFRVTVARMGGQHTVREVMSDIMAMENARTEIKQLRQWKAEATTVIGDWQAVFDSLVAPRVSQFDFGKSTSVLTAKEIVRLSSEIEWLETVRKQLLDAARGYMDMVVGERNKNERLRAAGDRLAEFAGDNPWAHIDIATWQEVRHG